MKRYVITGGPCTGKTTTLYELERRGFPVVREAATIVFSKEGRNLDFNEAQRKILAMQLDLEALADIEPRKLYGPDSLFLDRGAPDGIAYHRHTQHSIPAAFLRGLERRYDGIFILEPLGLYEQTTIRNETPEQALKLHELMVTTYELLGYKPVRIPKASINERVEMILDEIHKALFPSIHNLLHKDRAAGGI